MCDQHSDVPVTLADGRVVGVDGCIAPLVQVLNDNGFPTAASCCGHGTLPATIPLADDRWLILSADRADGERMVALFAVRHLAARVTLLEDRLADESG
jgi:hypothetical protein